MLHHRCTHAILFIFLIFAGTARISQSQTLEEQAKHYLQLNADEWREVQTGAIIVRPNTDKSLGGSGLILLDSPSWRVWQVITDYPEYPIFFPRSVRFDIDQVNGDLVWSSNEYRSALLVPNIRNRSRIEHTRKDPNALEVRWIAEKTNLTFNRGRWLIFSDGKQSLLIHQSSFALNWIARTLALRSSTDNIYQILKAVRQRIPHPRYDKFEESLDYRWAEEYKKTESTNPR